jgi:hypothetical protein
VTGEITATTPAQSEHPAVAPTPPPPSPALSSSQAAPGGGSRRRLNTLAARVLTVAVLTTVPVAGALLAIRFAPPSQVEIAGAPVSVKPVLGQNVSKLQGGALVRPEHAHVGGPGLLGTDVGVNIGADWNQLIPSDKETRRYLIALWNDPRPEIERIQDAAYDYVVMWGLIGFGAALAAEALVVAVWWYRRRRLGGYTPEQAALIGAYNRRLRAAVVSTVLVTAIVVDSAGAWTWAKRHPHVVASSPLLAGTTLAGTEVNGLMADILPFLSVLRPRDTFYDRVQTNLEKALTNRPDLQPGSGAGGDRIVFVLAEDFEDVNGMAREVGLTAHLLNANFIALSGDLTFAGKPVESYLIDTVDYYSQHTSVYFAPGLHDTRAIVDAARARGWHVADGRTQTVDGLSLLAVADPRVSNVGNLGIGDLLRDPNVDLDTFVSDTSAEACATHPDFVLLHDHVLGREIAETGCTRQAVLDGRSYQFVGPRTVPTDPITADPAAGGAAYELTIGSAGGHVDTEPDPGDLQHPASFAVITYSPGRQLTKYAVVTVNPDASVTVTRKAPLSVPYGDLTVPKGSASTQLR